MPRAIPYLWLCSIHWFYLYMLHNWRRVILNVKMYVYVYMHVLFLMSRRKTARYARQISSSYVSFWAHGEHGGALKGVLNGEWAPNAVRHGISRTVATVSSVCGRREELYSDPESMATAMAGERKIISPFFEIVFWKYIRVKVNIHKHVICGNSDMFLFLLCFRSRDTSETAAHRQEGGGCFSAWTIMSENKWAMEQTLAG